MAIAQVMYVYHMAVTLFCDISGKREAFTAGNKITFNAWNYVTGVIRGPTDMSVYINGVDGGTLTYQGSGGNMANEITSQGSIGGITECNINSDFMGKIDGNVASNSGSAGPSLNAGMYNFDSPATYGSGWTLNGKFGKALNFDRADNYVQINSTTALPTGSGAPWTLSAWVKTNVVDLNSHVIVTYGNNTNNSTPRIMIYCTNKWTFTTYGPANNLYGNIARAGVWTHIVGTCDGASLYLYENGH